jgi:hypothetical protein
VQGKGSGIVLGILGNSIKKPNCMKAKLKGSINSIRMKLKRKNEN